MRRDDRQRHLAEAIINSGENRAVCREIEDSLAQQRDTARTGEHITPGQWPVTVMSFVDNLPALPSRLTLLPLENESSLRYKIGKIFYQ